MYRVVLIDDENIIVEGLFRPLFGIENGKYIQYSPVSDASIGRKISRSQSLPIYSEVSPEKRKRSGYDVSGSSH